MKQNVLIKAKLKKYINEYLDKEYGIPLYRKIIQTFGDGRIVKNEWLIHSTFEDAAINIARNGFSNGLSKNDMNRASLTISSYGQHEDNGFSWAYTANRIIKCKYKDPGTSILFQASGVEYYNEVDQTKQIIFFNKSAYNKILIYEWDGPENTKDKFETYHNKTMYGVGNVNGKPLYVGVFYDVVRWVITNFEQYKKNLLSTKTPVHVSDNFEKEYEKYLDRNGYSVLPDNSLNIYQKWRTSDEENKDTENYSKAMEKAYLEFLEKNKELVNTIKKEAIQQVESLGFNIDPEKKRKILDKIIDTVETSRGLDYTSFVKEYQKKHTFYHRVRPDGMYWRF